MPSLDTRSVAKLLREYAQAVGVGIGPPIAGCLALQQLGRLLLGADELLNEAVLGFSREP